MLTKMTGVVPSLRRQQNTLVLICESCDAEKTLNPSEARMQHLRDSEAEDTTQHLSSRKPTVRGAEKHVFHHDSRFGLPLGMTCAAPINYGSGSLTRWDLQILRKLP